MRQVQRHQLEMTYGSRLDQLESAFKVMGPSQPAADHGDPHDGGHCHDDQNFNPAESEHDRLLFKREITSSDAVVPSRRSRNRKFQHTAEAGVNRAATDTRHRGPAPGHWLP